MVVAFITISSLAFAAPYKMEPTACPNGGTYNRCWTDCSNCNCDVSAQTLCGGGGGNNQ